MDPWNPGLTPRQTMLADKFPDPTLWHYYDSPPEHTVRKA